METIPIPQGTAPEMLTPLQAPSLPAQGPFPSLLQQGGGCHPAGVPAPGFSHSISAPCAFGAPVFWENNAPHTRLGAGLCSRIQPEFGDDSGARAAPGGGDMEGRGSPGMG